MQTTTGLSVTRHQLDSSQVPPNPRAVPATAERPAVSPSSHSQSLRLCGIGAVAAAACCGASTSYPDPCGCVVLFSCWGLLGATNETRRGRLMISSCLPWATLHASAEYCRENAHACIHSAAGDGGYPVRVGTVSAFPSVFVSLVFSFFVSHSYREGRQAGKLSARHGIPWDGMLPEPEPRSV